MENAVISDNKDRCSKITKRDFSYTTFFAERKFGENAAKGSIIQFARPIKLGVIGNAGQPFHRSISSGTLSEPYG